MSTPQVRAQEDRIHGRMLSALRRWLARVSDVVVAPARRQDTLPDATAIGSTIGIWNAEIAQLRPELLTAARLGWSQVTGAPTFSSTSAGIQRALQASENMLRGVPDEVHNLIRDEIADGLAAGQSRSQIADRVDSVLTITGQDRWTGRARTIAVTETTRASQAGALGAALAAETSLGRMLKRWNDESDPRVRPAHRIVDGDEVPLMRPFIVDGAPLMYPGDPTGPPDTVIGCRCDLTFRRANA